MEEEEDNLTVLVPPPACKGSPSSGVVTTSSPYDASIVGLGSTTKERLVNILKEKDRTIAKLQARVSELEAELFNNKTTSQDALVSNSNASLSTSSPKSYIHNHLGSVCSSTVKLVGADKQSTAQAVDTGLSLRRGGACSDDTEHRMEPIHVTDTQRIISRYNDLKKGSKGKKHLQFDATKKLLKPSLIIEFAEDNPSFWRKIDALDENVESLRAHLQHLVTVARSYCNIGNSFCEHGRELASALLHLHGEDWLKRLGLVAHILVHFGETLDEIQNYVEAFLLSLENTFTAPMEEFVKREVKNIRKMKNVVHRTSVEYETGLSNLLSLKNNCDELAAEARLSEVATMKKRFELARFDLVHHLNQLETKKKFQLVERVCNALYAFLGLFHQCHTEVARIEPSMRDMQYALHFARKDFARSNGIWDAKRVNLELELNRKFLCVWGGSDDVSLHLNNLDADLAFHRSSTGNDAMISGTSLGVVHQLSQKPENINRSVSLSAKATVDESVSHNVLSSTTSETNSNTGPPESVPVVYSGYLWKKNSRVRSSSRRKNWKRRWFSVHGGTLSYEKYSLPPGSSILVRNLELCTVCACEAPSDYRFSFEIIGPTQRTCRLQAESEVSRQAWMEAIKLEIERVLCLELKNNHSSSSFNQSPPTPVQKYSTPAIFDMEVAAALQRLTRVNNTCADCGAPDPKWASINLGILICRECSGCHRSMVYSHDPTPLPLRLCA